jgi:hypothetical protein
MADMQDGGVLALRLRGMGTGAPFVTIEQETFWSWAHLCTAAVRRYAEAVYGSVEGLLLEVSRSYFADSWVVSAQGGVPHLYITPGVAAAQCTASPRPQQPMQPPHPSPQQQQQYEQVSGGSCSSTHSSGSSGGPPPQQQRRGAPPAE